MTIGILPTHSVRDPESSVPRLGKELKGFRAVCLAPGERCRLTGVYLGLVLMALLWGLVFVAFKIGGREMPVEVFNADRFVLGVSILALVVPNLLFLLGVREIGRSGTAVFVNAVPPIGCLAGWLILDETMNGMQASGAVLILAGIYLSQAKRTEQTKE